MILIKLFNCYLIDLFITIIIVFIYLKKHSSFTHKYIFGIVACCFTNLNKYNLLMDFNLFKRGIQVIACMSFIFYVILNKHHVIDQYEYISVAIFCTLCLFLNRLKSYLYHI